MKTLKKRSFKITGKAGTKYTFKVRGINGKKKGKFSKVKSVTIAKKVLITKKGAVELTNKQVKSYQADGIGNTRKVHIVSGKNKNI